jgi:hypothetical protein
VASIGNVGEHRAPDDEHSPLRDGEVAEVRLLGGRTPSRRYRSGVDWLTGAREMLIAVGPTGSDVSYDGGRNWRAFDAAPYDAVVCVPGTCWASGPAGAVAVLARGG